MRIIIETRGGVVQNVISDSQHYLEVYVVDYDEDEKLEPINVDVSCSTVDEMIHLSTI